MRAPSGAAGCSPVRTVAATSTDAGPARTRRRIVGLIVLILAAAAVLVADPLAGIGVRGTATAAAIVLPPAVGSCVVIADDDAATVVDCTEPHTGEIAMTWRAGVDPVDAGAFDRQPHFSVARSVTVANADSRCAGWALRYTGWDRYVARHVGDLWLAPQPLSTGRLIRAPIHPALSALGLSGCAVVTADATYTGSLRDAAFAPRATAGPRPAVASVCLTSAASELSFGSCAQPHNTELIGSVSLTQRMMFERSVTIDATADDVIRGCVELAADRIGRSDPTFDGRLEVVAESVWQRPLQDRPPASSSWLIPDCLVRVVGTGSLTGSLVEWGQGPLTLAR